MPEISLDEISVGSRNPRINYSQESIERMARSMSLHGQLATVKVRPSKRNGKYEIIYGHRRVLAAKKLGWKTIRAELSQSDDQSIMWESLIENLEREELTDYEKAIFFERLHSEFGKTYGEIGSMVGISTQQVSNYVAMCRLFDASFMKGNPDIAPCLHGVTEHQARALSRVSDEKARANLLRMVHEQDLSVRDIENVVSKLRAWFSEAPRSPPEEIVPDIVADSSMTQKSEDVEKIKGVIYNKFKFAQAGDFSSFEKLYLFGKGYSIFPFLDRDLLEDEKAVLFKKDWISSFMPYMSWSVQSVKIQLTSEHSAVAMVRVKYQNKEDPTQEVRLRGTMVLVRRVAKWKIFHEHWSMPDANPLLVDFRNEMVRGRHEGHAVKPEIRAVVSQDSYRNSRWPDRSGN